MAAVLDWTQGIEAIVPPDMSTQIDATVDPVQDIEIDTSLVS